MADEKMVKVKLDQQRMYRAKHEDREAITVGPGEVEVPAWVAAEWAKPAPTQQQPVAETSTGKTDIERLTAELASLRAEFERWKQPQTASQGQQQTPQPSKAAPAVPRKG